MAVVTALTLVGVIILIGFIGNFIFRKTDIPNIIWLLAIGLAVGPIFNLVDPSLFLIISEFFAAVAIIIILFDGGINMDLYKLFRGAPLGVLLTLLAFSLSVTVTTVFMLALGYPLLSGILLGAIIGGTSSPIIIPIVSKLKGLSEKTKTVLSIESAITDVLCIVVAIAIMQAMSLGGEAGIMSAVRPITVAFSVGIIMGLASGIIWIPLMHRIIKEEFSYVVTLGVLFFLYAGTEFLTGSGALAVLVFGIILGNGRKIFNILKYTNKAFEIDQTTRQFHSLISFFMRTFFFVYLGILVSIGDIKYIFIGVVLILLLLAVRGFAILVVTLKKEEFKTKDKTVMTVMLSRGLAAAVLALLPMSMGLPNTEGFADIAFVIILGTALIPTIGVLIANKISEKPGEEAARKPEEEIEKPKVVEVKHRKKKKT